jgi:hypothetical protein
MQVVAVELVLQMVQVVQVAEELVIGTLQEFLELLIQAEVVAVEEITLLVVQAVQV